MQDVRQNVLWMAAFVVVAVVMMGAAMLPMESPEAAPGFGPEALPFACDLTREGAGPDDMAGRFTLRLGSLRDGDFPVCAVLERGTALRPRPGREEICMAHLEGAGEARWQDALGGEMRIGPDGAVIYRKKERPSGADVFATGFVGVTYTGTCAGAT
jgi:hypothetical protein